MINVVPSIVCIMLMPVFPRSQISYLILITHAILVRRSLLTITHRRIDNRTEVTHVQLIWPTNGYVVCEELGLEEPIGGLRMLFILG